LLTSKKVSCLFLRSSIFSTGFPANVAYRELSVSLSRIPPEQRCFLPNTWYSSSWQHDYLRLVALMSTTDIEEGDELFSAYYTLVLWSCFIGPLPVVNLTGPVRSFCKASHCQIWLRFRAGFLLCVNDMYVKRWTTKNNIWLSMLSTSCHWHRHVVLFSFKEWPSSHFIAIGQDMKADRYFPWLVIYVTGGSFLCGLNFNSTQAL
jgi:hypothetical protein